MYRALVNATSARIREFINPTTSQPREQRVIRLKKYIG
jgi:hypothetical protein